MTHFVIQALPVGHSAFGRLAAMKALVRQGKGCGLGTSKQVYSRNLLIIIIIINIMMIMFIFMFMFIFIILILTLVLIFVFIFNFIFTGSLFQWSPAHWASFPSPWRPILKIMHPEDSKVIFKSWWKLLTPHGKLTWQWKIRHEWRCISYWLQGIVQPVMLVNSGV